ncbi:hypothetical protein ARSEF4850_002725 [Beauveria asiatica]
MASSRAARTLRQRLWNSAKHNWSLGLTSFGGPPVHFKIVRQLACFPQYEVSMIKLTPTKFHTLYVEKLQWIDEQIYQELFSVSQALSGPASTKMQYCVTMGVWGAVCGSPGVKSFLKGLNAVAVGLIYTTVYRIWQVGYIA